MVAEPQPKIVKYNAIFFPPQSIKVNKGLFQTLFTLILICLYLRTNQYSFDGNVLELGRETDFATSKQILSRIAIQIQSYNPTWLFLETEQN